jgi:hypothetical protein
MQGIWLSTAFTWLFLSHEPPVICVCHPRNTVPLPSIIRHPIQLPQGLWWGFTKGIAFIAFGGMAMIWDGREQGASATTTWDGRCVDNKRLAGTRATCGRNKMGGKGSESEGLECTARTHPHVASDVVATTCIHHSQGALYGSRVTWERHSDAIGAITKHSSPFSAPNSRMGGLLQML